PAIFLLHALGDPGWHRDRRGDAHGQRGEVVPAAGERRCEDGTRDEQHPANNLHPLSSPCALSPTARFPRNIREKVLRIPRQYRTRRIPTLAICPIAPGLADLAGLRSRRRAT